LFSKRDATTLNSLKERVFVATLNNVDTIAKANYNILGVKPFQIREI